jgi:hypothetical protein
MGKPPLTFTFYMAAPIEKVWNGFVSKETNQTNADSFAVEDAPRDGKNISAALIAAPNSSFSILVQEADGARTLTGGSASYPRTM